MQTYQVGLMGLALIAILTGIAIWSWRRRVSKQEALMPAPREIQTLAEGQKAFYVATTFAGRRLERVTAHGLGHRGRATLKVEADGIHISRTGEFSFMIPRIDLLSQGSNSAVIDRAVEKDGLTTLSWRLGHVELETHFRFVGEGDRSRFESDVRALLGVSK
jgi:hypothetical protein